MAYIPILRQYPTTDHTAPWDGIVFTHQIGSDELNEALKASLPQYRTLRERKCAAAIEFFERELAQMQLEYAKPPAKTSPAERLARPEGSADTCAGEHLKDSVASNSSTASSLTSRARGDSDKRYFSVSSLSSTADPTLATSSTSLVFNAFDGRTMHQKSKRKMTSEEKEEYKRTRQRGACARCRRQKGKVGTRSFDASISDLTKCTHTTDDYLAPIDANGLSEKLQGLATDTTDSQSDAIDQTEPTLNTFSHNLDQNPSRRSSYASSLSPTTSHQPQWLSVTGLQSDTLGYVHPSPSYSQDPGSVSGDPLSSYWPGYEQSNTGHVDHAVFSNAGGDSQGYSAFPAPSPCIYIQEHNSDAFCMSATQSYDPWSPYAAG